MVTDSHNFFEPRNRLATEYCLSTLGLMLKRFFAFQILSIHVNLALQIPDRRDSKANNLVAARDFVWDRIFHI